MSSIEMIAVAKHYGDVRAVDDVSLRVDDGEFVTILGPSGSGKSTMLSLISGLTEPTSGRILIEGKDVTDLPAALRNVGLVFQSYALFPNMTVQGNVAFPLEVRGVQRAQREARVAEALRLVRLDGLEARKPSQLSGGQQQRVALARAIVFSPSILLLDEPLAALDRKLREDVRIELRGLQRSLGITTVLVTHDQDEALSLSDRIVVLEGGQVQQSGRPEELYRRPANRFVAEFLGTANLVRGTLRQTATGMELVLTDGSAVHCEHSDAGPASEAMALVRPERIRIGPEGEGLRAIVLDAAYFGQSVRYHLSLSDGSEIVATAPDPSPRFARNARVSVAWLPEDVWIIPGAANRTVPTARARSAIAVPRPGAPAHPVHQPEKMSF